MAFSYHNDPNRLMKSVNISDYPCVLRGKKSANEKKDLREVPDSIRIIDRLIAKNKIFSIHMSTNCPITKDLGEIPTRLREEREPFGLNQIIAKRRKENVAKFKEFKRYLNAMRSKNTHDAIRSFFARQEKEYNTTFKELIGPSDNMTMKKVPKFANQFLATKGKENTQRSPDINRVIEAPDIRRAIMALLKTSILINAIGRKKNFGTLRKAGGT